MGTAIATVIGLIASGFLVAGANNIAQGFAAEDSLKKYNQAIKGTGLENYSLKDIFGLAYNTGVIDEASYKNTITALDAYSADELSSSNINNWASLFKNNTRLRAAVEDMYTKLPELQQITNRLNNLDPEDLKSYLNSNAASIPAPSYFSNTIEGERFDVHDPRLLTGQEMADLHGINYNPEYYYDLIKQGTEANVNLGHFTADQQRAASNWNNEAQLADYLKSVQDAKSSAIANGSTAGARAAAEILANRENAQSKLQTGLTTAQNRFATVDDYLRADADARKTARSYFDSLAQSLSTDAASYYTNDVEDYVGDLTANANMAAGDWNLWGIRQQANGMMAGAYAQNKAVVDAANAASNEFFDVYNTFYNARKQKGDINAGANAFRETQDYIVWSNNSNYNNYYDVLKDRTTAQYDPLGYLSFNASAFNNLTGSNSATKK